MSELVGPPPGDTSTPISSTEHSFVVQSDETLSVIESSGIPVVSTPEVVFLDTSEGNRPQTQVNTLVQLLSERSADETESLPTGQVVFGEKSSADNHFAMSALHTQRNRALVTRMHTRRSR